MTRVTKALPIVLLLAAGLAACEKKTATDKPAPAPSTPSPSAPSPSAEKPTKPDAMNQGNAQADLDVTAAIRKAVNARDDIAAGTKGTLVIVTEAGQVTLKGPVASEAEKKTIADIAAANAGSRTLDNQLTVTPAVSGTGG